MKLDSTRLSVACYALKRVKTKPYRGISDMPHLSKSFLMLE